MNTNNLKRMVELTVSLHKLILNNMDESDEGENIRDESDQYWDALSEEDKDWLRKFSASLYDMTDGLQNSLRWIPVTEQLPPHDTYVDFLGADGGGHGSRGLSKEDCEKYSLTYNPIPKIYENETGPYILGKDQQGVLGSNSLEITTGN